MEANNVQHKPRGQHSTLLLEFMDLMLHTFRLYGIAYDTASVRNVMTWGKDVRVYGALDVVNCTK